MIRLLLLAMQVDGKNGVDLVVGGKGHEARTGWLESPANPRDLAAWKWHPISEVGWLMSIIPSDTDSDGDVDILLTDRRRELRGCRWLENPGPGDAQDEEWPNHFIEGRDVEVMFMTLADLDGDGLQDALVASKEAQVLHFRRLDSSGKRWAEIRIPYPEGMGTAKAIAVGDLDADGRDASLFGTALTRLTLLTSLSIGSIRSMRSSVVSTKSAARRESSSISWSSSISTGTATWTC
jgi:hypothetical protein